MGTLRTNKPMRMDFLSVFLEDFRGPRKTVFLALKMERKNINRCLGGLRMEDQRERSPQTFLVNKLSFLQPWEKQDDYYAFK